MIDRGVPISAYLRLYEYLMAPDCATQSSTSAVRFGRESEAKLATLHLRLRHGGLCES